MRSAIRLWITLGLGLLGAWVSLDKMDFYPIPLISTGWKAIIAWIAAMFLGVRLLRWMEKTTPIQSLPEIKTGRRFLRIKKFLSHVARVSMAPYFLYASRPVDYHGVRFSTTALTKAGFAVFPFFFAMGVTHFIGISINKKIGFMLFSLSIWTWLGCSLLFLLSPPRKYPRFPDVGGVLKNGKYGFLLIAFYIAVSGLFLLLSFPLFFWRSILFSPIILVLIMFVFFSFPFFYLLSPSAADSTNSDRLILKTSPVLAAFAVIFAFAPIVLFIYRPLHALLDKQMPAMVKSMLFFLTIFIIAMFFFLIIVRGVTNRQTWLGYFTFSIPTTLVNACLLFVLTSIFFTLLFYVGKMGFTSKRLCGLAYLLTACIIVSAFLCWATWPPKYRALE